VGSVEKPADEEPSGRRFLEWVVRHAGWARSESIQPVAKTGVIWTPALHAFSLASFTISVYIYSRNILVQI
jgi:hypothetical protein